MSEPMKLEDARTELLRTLRRQGISDAKVLDAIAQLSREDFLPAAIRHLAYENQAVSIGHGQTISQPYIVALMTEELNLSSQERVLEVGTGSGYQCALLARLAKEVFTVERIPELSLAAQVLLARLGIDNVRFHVGDGSEGWIEHAPFERIIVTAASPSVPPSLVEQLAEGGILVIPVGGDAHQSLLAYRKEAGQISDTHLCECRFVRLIGAQGW